MEAVCTSQLLRKWYVHVTAFCKITESGKMKEKCKHVWTVLISLLYYSIIQEAENVFCSMLMEVSKR